MYCLHHAVVIVADVFVVAFDELVDLNILLLQQLMATIVVVIVIVVIVIVVIIIIVVVICCSGHYIIVISINLSVWIFIIQTFKSIFIDFR